MAGVFPTSVTVYTNPTGTSHVDVPVGGRTLDQFIADLCDDMESVQTKLGIGASTPGSNTVLRGSSGGASVFGQVQTGDVAAGAITGSGYSQAASAVNIASTAGYVDIMTLAYTSAGGDLLLIATTSTYILSGTPGNHWLSVRYDTQTDLDLAQHDGIGVKMLTGVRLFTGVAAGAHTIAMRGVNGAAGTYQSFYRTLTVLELKK